MSPVLNLQTLPVADLDFSAAISSGSCDSSSCNSNQKPGF
jgi:hypothetical protein